MSVKRRLGFVGFGAMSKKMAAHLSESGFSVVAFDPAYKEEQVDGFRLMANAAAVAREVDAVIISVPSDVALEMAVEGPGGILEGAHDGLLLIDTSTVSPPVSIRLAEAAKKRGVRFIEAPVSGSTPEAEKGQLVVLAGGSESDVAFAAPILDVIGRKTVYAGPVGQGMVMKLVINGVMAMGTAALAEGIAYGAGAGLDRKTLIETLQDLILVSEHHRRKLEMAKQNAYPPQFGAKLLFKDMGLLLADAGRRGVPMNAMAAASQLFAFSAARHPNDDYSIAIEDIEAMTH